MDSVFGSNQEWMVYIDSEARAACDKKGWGCQIRRRWSVRDKPVSKSLVDDYEWKLIPGTNAKVPEQHPIQFEEGIYYILSFDPHGGKFVLQHDTIQGGLVVSFVKSFTEIDVRLFLPNPPEEGWLRDLLVDLTSRFKPNQFSLS
jgi:hypothetical protein